jgi:hypothetical protein
MGGETGGGVDAGRRLLDDERHGGRNERMSSLFAAGLGNKSVAVHTACFFDSLCLLS